MDDGPSIKKLYNTFAALKSKLCLGNDVALIKSVVGAPIVLHIAIISNFYTKKLKRITNLL